MGALIDLWPRLNVPLYATPFTAALFEARRLSEPGAPKIPVNVVPLGGRLALGPFAIELINVAHSIPESNALAIRTPARHRAAYRRLEDRSDPACRLGHRRGEALRARRRGRARARRRFDQRHPRRPIAVGSRRREDPCRTRPHRARPRGGDDVCLPRRPHPRGRRRRARRRPRGGGGRPRDGAGHAGRARDRLSRRRAGFPRRRSYGYLPPDKVLALCTGSQGEPRAALARIAEDEHPEVTLGAGRPRDLFLPRHPRQREGGGARHQRPGDAGRRGHHRPHPSRSRLRTSAARRTPRYDRLGAAENPHSGPWRSAAPCRACRAGPQGRRSRRSWSAATAIWSVLRPDRRPSSTRCRPAGSTRTVRSWSTPRRAPWHRAGG